MKKIFLSLAMIAVVSIVAVGATRAYFSDTATSTGNTFTAGTLDLQLKNNDSTDWNTTGITGTWTTPLNWAPGDYATGTIHMTNTGSVNSHHVYFSFYNKTGTESFMDKIIVTNLKEIFNSTETVNQASTLAGQIGNRDSVLTLGELVNFMYGGYGFYSYDDQSSDGIILQSGNLQDYHITFTFQFDPNAGNEYQGLTTGFDLKVNATQNSPTEGMVQI